MSLVVCIGVPVEVSEWDLTWVRGDELMAWVCTSDSDDVTYFNDT